MIPRNTTSETGMPIRVAKKEVGPVRVRETTTSKGKGTDMKGKGEADLPEIKNVFNKKDGITKETKDSGKVDKI